MTLRRKLRYHPQCLKQLISELTQNFLHLTPCVSLNYAGNLTGTGVQRRTEPRPYPHITLGTLFYTCVWAWFPLGHRGCVLPGKKAVLLLSASQQPWHAGCSANMYCMKVRSETCGLRFLQNVLRTGRENTDLWFDFASLNRWCLGKYMFELLPHE